MDDLAEGWGQKTIENPPSPLNTGEREGRRRKRDLKQKKNNTESSNEKPWRNPGADITDYFNYGFTEESWEDYRQKQRMMRMSMRKMVDSCSRHQEARVRPSSASDSCRLFPRRSDSCRSSDQDQWTRRSRKASSSAEDRATHLFTSPDSMCPSDPRLKILSTRSLDRGGNIKMSRDRKEHREVKQKERRRRHDQDKTSHTQQEQEKNRGRSRRGHKGNKRRSQAKETAKKTSSA